MSPVVLNSLETTMKVEAQIVLISRNLQYWLKPLDPRTTMHISKRFLKNFDSCLEYKSVSYTMVYTPCFEEEYFGIKNQSSCLCVESFLKAGLYSTKHLWQEAESDVE